MSRAAVDAISAASRRASSGSAAGLGERAFANGFARGRAYRDGGSLIGTCLPPLRPRDLAFLLANYEQGPLFHEPYGYPVYLFRRQGALAPLGQRFTLGELHAEDLTDQVSVAQGIGLADKPGGELQVEQVARRLSCPAAAQAHFLPAGVDHHCSRRVDDESPELIERPGAERVDQEKTFRRCHLHQAQPRMVDVLADRARTVRKEKNAVSRLLRRDGQAGG